jgi:DNA invertase Pin-like site-specific DNA recombinase
MSFTWPKGMQPNEKRWLMCIDIINEVCSAENKILQRKVNLSHAQREAGLKGGRKRNERHYQIIKEMSEKGYSNDQIARRLDITRQRLYEFRSKHKI